MTNALACCLVKAANSSLQIVIAWMSSLFFLLCQVIFSDAFEDDHIHVI